MTRASSSLMVTIYANKDNHMQMSRYGTESTPVILYYMYRVQLPYELEDYRESRVGFVVTLMD